MSTAILTSTIARSLPVLVDVLCHLRLDTPTAPPYSEIDGGVEIALTAVQATLAQLVEHSFRKAGVQGSSP